MRQRAEGEGERARPVVGPVRLERLLHPHQAAVVDLLDREVELERPLEREEVERAPADAGVREVRQLHAAVDVDEHAAAVERTVHRAEQRALDVLGQLGDRALEVGERDALLGDRALERGAAELALDRVPVRVGGLDAGERRERQLDRLGRPRELEVPARELEPQQRVDGRRRLLRPVGVLGQPRGERHHRLAAGHALAQQRDGVVAAIEAEVREAVAGRAGEVAHRQVLALELGVLADREHADAPRLAPLPAGEP